MKCRILRGTQEIGGSCVELSYDGDRIILDCGLPLDTQEADITMVPDVKGLLEKTDDLKGIVVSHYHQDHSGLLPFVDPSIPVAMGADARNIMNVGAYFQKKSYKLNDFIPLKNGKSIYMGKFKITPYITDHSAYDSYALLIEAGDKKLFYSGDLRAHGRKAALFDVMLKQLPADIDTLLMEGSSINRLADDGKFQTESEIENRLHSEFLRAKGLTLVAVSGQNIDRLVSIYRAAKRSGKEIIIDPYVAESLRATGNSRIPQFDWPNMKIFIPEWARGLIATTQRFELLEDYKPNRVFLDYVERNARNIVMLFRPSVIPDLEQQPKILENASLIYSMWEGYFLEKNGEQIREFINAHNIKVNFIHTSGHADVPTLKRLSESVAPKKLVPIHTFEAGRYPELFSNVKCVKDGEIWDC